MYQKAISEWDIKCKKWILFTNLDFKCTFAWASGGIGHTLCVCWIKITSWINHYAVIIIVQGCEIIELPSSLGKMSV
jgi:hypothetical protein